jgi:hypothetical protein
VFVPTSLLNPPSFLVKAFQASQLLQVMMNSLIYLLLILSPVSLALDDQYDLDVFNLVNMARAGRSASSPDQLIPVLDSKVPLSCSVSAQTHFL